MELTPFPFAQPPENEEEPEYADLRESARAHGVELPYGGHAWLVTRHSDVRFVLGDRRFGRAATSQPDVPRLLPEPGSEGLLQSLDPPDHRRVRGAVQGSFTARRMRRLRPRVEQIVAGLLDDIEASGEPADLVASFAVPLPVAVICEVLGVPPVDRADLARWSAALLSTSGAQPADRERAHREMLGLFDGLLSDRAARPRDDVLSTLAHAGRLTRAEAIALASDLLLAGHETTGAQLANSVFVLLRAGGLHRLGEGGAAVRRTVEELMRFVPLGAGGTRCRVAHEDVVVGGVSVRAGAAVFAVTTSANRDPAVFQCPQRLDPQRARVPHLAFGYGDHHCLGAPLARLQLQVGLDSLRVRMPRLRPAEGSGMTWRTGSLVRGPERFPVVWS
ncbi:cytochrome P450 [Pseudonocardia sp. HH130630-07]|uniref:cytochrome P450 n=1 Tax=Pseudonocardia sp. HH130630-07 TaxID=1690815 RepID=UPI000814EFC5|nr:cytochrome P450 [Pseudonocardia sp. HH130630-07]ANY10849.1 hypothetical protein AFB00_31145 [Pseudonocardia sp. HH130630-07]